MSSAKVAGRNYVPKLDRAAKSPQIQTTKTSMRFADARSQNPTSVYLINIEGGIDERAEVYITKMRDSFSRAQED